MIPDDTTIQSSFEGMVGASLAMRRLYDLIDAVASTRATCLILGETGTGKELVAHAIHRRGTPAAAFVAVNAAAIPAELIESTLFGHERGAFTGADRQHIGCCERAAGGTLFIDEFAEMDIAVQAKLLRFLQDQWVQPVGAMRPRRVECRVIAATNRAPENEITAGRLREDLYHRLNVVPIALPPLRQRPTDIPLLVEHFLARHNARHGRTVGRIAPDALQRLVAHPWPGNVRELEHLIERLVVTHRCEVLTAAMLPAAFFRRSPRPVLSAPHSAVAAPDPAQPLTLAQLERQAIVHALAACNNSVPQAARRLDVAEATVYRKIRKYGIRRE